MCLRRRFILFSKENANENGSLAMHLVRTDKLFCIDKQLMFSEREGGENHRDAQ
jgi:hypothetical protein